MENKYYDLVIELVKKHRKFSSVESIMDDIVSDVLERAKVVIANITNQDVVEAYLSKIISISMITVPKKMNLNPRAVHKTVSTFNDNLSESLESIDIVNEYNENKTTLDEDQQVDVALEEEPILEAKTEEFALSNEEIQVDKNLVDKMINGIASTSNDAIEEIEFVQDESFKFEENLPDEDVIVLDEDSEEVEQIEPSIEEENLPDEDVIVLDEGPEDVEQIEPSIEEDSFSFEHDKVDEIQGSELLVENQVTETLLLEEAENNEFEDVIDNTESSVHNVVEIEAAVDNEENIDFENDSVICLDETDEIAFKNDAEAQEDLAPVELSGAEQEEILEEFEEDFVPVNLAEAISREDVDEFSEDQEGTFELEENSSNGVYNQTEVNENEEYETENIALKKAPNYSLFECQNLQRELDIDFVKTTLKDLDSKKTELKVLEIWQLKYNDKLSINEIAGKLGFSNSQVLETLNEIIDAIKD